MFRDPVVVEYDFHTGGVTTMLGSELDVDDGAIVAHELYTAERPDDPWRGLSQQTRRFTPENLRRGQTGFQQVDTSDFSIKVLRDGHVEGAPLTPAKAMNGMFDAAQSLLTDRERTDFELIVEGMIEVNGHVLDRPAQDQIVYLNAGPNHHTVFVRPEFKRLNNGLIIAGKETLTWRGDAEPRAYDRWEHTTKIKGDRGRFAHTVNWHPGVMRLEPQAVEHHSGLQVVHGKGSQIITVDAQEIINTDGVVMSPFEFTRQA